MKRVIGNEGLPGGDNGSSTLPSMSYISETVQHLVEKNAKKRVFVKDSLMRSGAIRSDATKKVTLSTDGFTEERQKYQTHNVVLGKEGEDQTIKKHCRALGINVASKSDSEAIFGARLSAGS